MTLNTPMRSMKKTLVLIAAAAGLTLSAGPALASGGGHALPGPGDGPAPWFPTGRRGVRTLALPLDGAADMAPCRRRQARLLIVGTKAVQRILFHIRKA